MNTFKIYLPDINYECYEIIEDGVIRAYEEKPEVNSTSNYRDYFINSHYMHSDGQTQFGNDFVMPVCMDSALITNEVYYRNDFAEILIIFLIMCIFGFYIPIKAFLRLFRRFN